VRHHIHNILAARDCRGFACVLFHRPPFCTSVVAWACSGGKIATAVVKYSPRRFRPSIAS
jgi:hypothetical protein